MVQLGGHFDMTWCMKMGTLWEGKAASRRWISVLRWSQQNAPKHNIPSKNTHHGGGRRLDAHQPTSKSQRWRFYIINARGKKRTKEVKLSWATTPFLSAIPLIRLQREANQNNSWKGLFYGNRKFNLSQSIAQEGASFEVRTGVVAEEMAHSEG